MKRAIYLTKNGHNVSLRASFGVAAFPEDSDTRAGLLALADKAMFHVKQTGKDSIGITQS
jgi:GGDEF domain-containing protein